MISLPKRPRRRCGRHRISQCRSLRAQSRGSSRRLHVLSVPTNAIRPTSRIGLRSGRKARKCRLEVGRFQTRNREEVWASIESPRSTDRHHARCCSNMCHRAPDDDDANVVPGACSSAVLIGAVPTCSKCKEVVCTLPGVTFELKCCRPATTGGTFKSSVSLPSTSLKHLVSTILYPGQR